ncbi:DUF952 domain-containing protein [Rhizobium sp. CFBP 8762]|uniref:DUF952 domain-containing protein n=1 Tax=Rhizobium sp. CFBP 8762 TaxID=2775279 RepID=UPI001784943B|nr:DUF952 domain-containing protein [Rhizobium sp. CFBP 8762]MBD8553564.1 DUF952 domain-containing protein [Rhizobium sp. CFBP 8762]
MQTVIYKIVTADQWAEARRTGLFKGSAVDLADGYIHFSTAAQVRETAAKHFRGESNLVLVAIDESRLGEALVYEPSRGAALFPHLYEPLSVDAVLWEKPLSLNADGTHQFPELNA